MCWSSAVVRIEAPSSISKLRPLGRNVTTKLTRYSPYIAALLRKTDLSGLRWGVSNTQKPPRSPLPLGTGERVPSSPRRRSAFQHPYHFTNPQNEENIVTE